MNHQNKLKSDQKFFKHHLKLAPDLYNHSHTTHSYPAQFWWKQSHLFTIPLRNLSNPAFSQSFGGKSLPFQNSATQPLNSSFLSHIWRKESHCFTIPLCNLSNRTSSHSYGDKSHAVLQFRYGTSQLQFPLTYLAERFTPFHNSATQSLKPNFLAHTWW